MTGLQLLTAGIGAVMLFITYTAFRRRELRLEELGVWAAVWAGLIAVSLLGDRLRSIVAPLQAARLLDLVMVATLIGLAIYVFSLNRQLRRYDRKLIELVRQLALRDLPGQQAGGQEENRIGEPARPSN
jgi:hypothetical protein